jgi:hypothetical protein
VSVKLVLSDNLARLAKGTRVFEVDGRTVGECINDLLSSVPAMKSALFYETHLDQSVTVLVNKEGVEGRDRLTSAVEEGDVVHIKLERH